MSVWPTARLDDVALRGSGHTPSKRRPEYWGGPIKWVSLADTGRLDQGYVAETEHLITADGLANSAAVLRPPDTVILLRGSSVGKSAVLATEMAVSQDYVTWTCGPRLDPWYLYYVLQARKAEFARIGFGNTIKTIGLDYFQHLTIPLPPIPEQQRVRQALRAADGLVSEISGLIAKKRDIKQGMMEELLTGRTRLPGYTGEWRELPVSELLEFKNGLNKASEYFGRGTPIVNFMDVMRAPVITADRVKGLVSLNRDEISRFSARRGDMFFTRTSESVDEIGTAAVLVDDVPSAVFSGFVLRGRPIASLNTTFLAYQFQLSSIRRQVIATASYTTRALTNGGSLGRVRMGVPSLEEQAALVSVVADVDAELAALERRLESARAVKTGMMQELLTGRTRLPVEAAS